MTVAGARSMIRPMRKALALLAALAALSPSLAAAQAVETKRMQFFYAKDASPEQRPLLESWQKSFRPVDPYGVLYQTFKVGDRTLTLVLGQQDSCDGGPQTPTSTQTWATCPLNIISQGPEGTRTQTIQDGCFLHPDRQVSPSAPDPQTNYTATVYDPRTKVIAVKTYQNGVEIPDCTKSLAVQ